MVHIVQLTLYPDTTMAYARILAERHLSVLIMQLRKLQSSPSQSPLVPHRIKSYRHSSHRKSYIELRDIFCPTYYRLAEKEISIASHFHTTP